MLPRLHSTHHWCKGSRKTLAIARRVQSGATPYRLQDELLRICSSADIDVHDHIGSVRIPTLVKTAGSGRLMLEDG